MRWLWKRPGFTVAALLTLALGIGATSALDRSQILGMVLKQGLSLAGAGLIIGLVGAFALSRLMQGLLYGVGPTDPITFATVAVVMLIVAFAASVLPARRATRVSPITAVRSLDLE